jgi:hypothetical protein
MFWQALVREALGHREPKKMEENIFISDFSFF